MYQDYLDESIKCMRNTTISAKGKKKFDDWEEGFDNIVQEFRTIKKTGKKVFVIGNGGSAGIALHMLGDFTKNGGVKTCSLYGTSLLTCLSNDLGYDNVFAKGIEFLGDRGDLLVAISSSGQSENIIRAVAKAEELGIRVITLSGFKKNNRIYGLGDVNLHVPSHEYGIVESLHNLFLQQIVDILMAEHVNFI